MPPIAVVIAVGPGARELPRLDALLFGLALHQPSIGPIVLLNDCGDAPALQASLTRHRLEGEVIPHPLPAGVAAWTKERPQGGRLTAGLARAYDHVRSRYPGHHVLKLDTDALIRRPFVEQLAGLIAANPRAGAIGTCPMSAGGVPERGSAPVFAYRLRKMICRWHRRPYVRLNFFGSRGNLRDLAKKVYENPVYDGFYLNGGAYLLTSPALAAFPSLAAYQDPDCRANRLFGEDCFFCMCTYAAGFELLKQNQAGDVFGVFWKGLPGKNYAEVAGRDHAILHSTKDEPPFTEAETLALFQPSFRPHVS